MLCGGAGIIIKRKRQNSLKKPSVIQICYMLSKFDQDNIKTIATRPDASNAKEVLLMILLF
jgi:hypothetical protein